MTFSKHKLYCLNLIKRSLKFKKRYKTKWKANGPTLDSKPIFLDDSEILCGLLVAKKYGLYKVLVNGYVNYSYSFKIYYYCKTGEVGEYEKVKPLWKNNLFYSSLRWNKPKLSINSDMLLKFASSHQWMHVKLLPLKLELKDIPLLAIICINLHLLKIWMCCLSPPLPLILFGN